MTVTVIEEVTSVNVVQQPPTNVSLVVPGVQGATGPSNVLSIGSVSALDPAQAPTVSLSGTSPSQTINFGIPVGAQILRGTAAPSTSLGQVGFWYINTTNWDVYEKTAAAVWTSRGNIKGATGNTGPAPNLTIGTVASATPGAAPTATITGTNPNYALNLNFPLANWTIGTTTSLVPGSAATSSVTGTALAPVLNLGIPRGAAILNGTTAPASGTGSQGDWHFNTVTSDLYEKTSSTVWTLRQNLKGAQGNIGNTGPANVLSIGTVTTAPVGSSAAATITGTAPTQTLNLTLPTGATGATGPAPNLTAGTVTTLAAGASATLSITGTNPNYVINIGVPQGLKGDVGAQWYTGAGAPSAGTGVNGDFYLVASGTGVGDFYKKASGSWVLQGNIRGQAGSGDVESVNNVLPVGGNVTLTWNDFSGTIPAAALPSMATTETYTVASQAAMLATGAQRGDLAIRTDLEDTYILSGDDPTVLGNWTLLLTDGSTVKLTGNQTIAGTKTFSSTPVVPDASWTIAKTSGLQAALDLKAPLASPTFTGTVSGITKAMVGLGNVNNAAQVELAGNQTIAGIKTFSSAPVVPDGSFTIAKTSGLQTALDGKAALAHTHAATEVTSGVFDIARIPTGTTGTTVALGNHLHTGVYEPLIAAGTTAQYRRGDNTWQTLDVAAVSGLQTALNLKAPLASPTFTGTVTAPTFSGSGASLTSLPAGQLTGANALPDSVLPARLGTLNKTVTVFNNIVENGWYKVYTADGLIANAPDATAGDWMVFVESYSPTYVTQTAFHLQATAPMAQKRYRRHMLNSVWGSWYKLSDTQPEQDARYAMLTGAQTIAGIKTFSSAPNLSSLTASTALVLDASKNIASSSVTGIELGYLSGVTSAIQTQLNGKAATSHTHTKSQITDFAHTHPISEITSLQAALDLKAPLASPTFTGTATVNGNMVIGSADTATTLDRSVRVETDTRGNTFTYVDGLMATAVEKSGGTTVRSTSFVYTDGLLTQSIETVAGKTITTTFVYTDGVLTGTSKVVA